MQNKDEENRVKRQSDYWAEADFDKTFYNENLLCHINIVSFAMRPIRIVLQFICIVEWSIASNELYDPIQSHYYLLPWTKTTKVSIGHGFFSLFFFWFYNTMFTYIETPNDHYQHCQHIKTLSCVWWIYVYVEGNAETEQNVEAMMDNEDVFKWKWLNFDVWST